MHGRLYEGRGEPLGFPSPEPAIPNGVEGELLTDGNGKYFVRNELNEHWVSYRYFDKDGMIRKGVALPRVQIISDEVIAEFDAIEAVEESQQVRVD